VGNPTTRAEIEKGVICMIRYKDIIDELKDRGRYLEADRIENEVNRYDTVRSPYDLEFDIMDPRARQAAKEVLWESEGW